MENMENTICKGVMAGLMSTGYAAEPGLSARPNILMILTDDQRYDDLGAAGNPVIRTPNLDRLAGTGVFFRHAYVSSSVCMASRATIFTGLVERRHACNFYYRNLAGDLWRQSYPVRLRAAGYRTGFIGKFGVTVDGFPAQTPREDFDWFRGYQGQGNYFPEGKDGPHLTRIEANQAIEFIRESARDKRPFCLSVSFFAPHDPMQPDPAFDDWYKGQTPPRKNSVRFEEMAGLPPAYREAAWYPRMHWMQHMSTPERLNDYILQRYRLVSGVDAAVGSIVRELEQQGLADRTVIVFTSDNGFHYGERGMATKFYMHDDSIHVPLIVADPRLPTNRRGQTVDRLVSTIDLAPTLLDLVGLQPSELMQGRSLLPLVRGDDVPWRDAIFAENIIKERRPMCDAIRTDRWKYIALFEQKPMQEELYDIENDPLEMNNLAGNPEHAGTLRELRARLQDMRVDFSGDTTGFPQWIQTQRENEENWKNYRRQYLELIKEQV